LHALGDPEAVLCIYMETAELVIPVVLITKEDNVRNAVSSTLEKAGFAISAVPNVASALVLCRESTVHIRLAIVDAGLRPIDEHGFVNALRQAVPGIRVIFMANSAEQEPQADRARPSKDSRVLRKTAACFASHFAGLGFSGQYSKS
jgi:CheY-like chemotaxis protein